jgi:hypothetical protein
VDEAAWVSRRSHQGGGGASGCCRGPRTSAGRPHAVAPLATAAHTRPVLPSASANVTPFVGENGPGKPALIEAIAMSAGFNPEESNKIQAQIFLMGHGDSSAE